MRKARPEADNPSRSSRQARPCVISGAHYSHSRALDAGPRPRILRNQAEYSPRVFTPPSHNRELYDTLTTVLSNIMSLLYRSVCGTDAACSSNTIRDSISRVAPSLRGPRSAPALPRRSARAYAWFHPKHESEVSAIPLQGWMSAIRTFTADVHHPVPPFRWHRSQRLPESARRWPQAS